MKVLKHFLLCLTVIVCAVSVQARVFVPLSDDHFDQLLTLNRLAVVHFNPYSPDLEIDEMEELKDIFRSLSREPRYRDGDITFIGVNLHEFPTIAKDYKLEAQELPKNGKDSLSFKENGVDEKTIASTVMLFKNGVPYKKDETPVWMQGIFTKKKLRELIENNFKRTIDKNLERKEERRQVRTQVVRVYEDSDDYYYPRYYGHPYYGGPYYRRPYYGYGPGFGFGLGFGRRGGAYPYFGFGW